MRQEDSAHRYRLGQANALLRRARVIGLDGKHHPAYQRTTNGSYTESAWTAEVRAVLGTEEVNLRFSMPGATCDGKIVPDAQDYEAVR